MRPSFKFSVFPISNFQISKVPNVNWKCVQNSSLRTSKCQVLYFQLPNLTFLIFTLSDVPILIFQKFKKTVHRPSNIFRLPCHQIWKLTSRTFPYLFVYFLLKYFADKYKVRGSRFSHIFGRSRNVPKSIAIDQDSLMNHLGIIKTP